MKRNENKMSSWKCINSVIFNFRRPIKPQLLNVKFANFVRGFLKRRYYENFIVVSSMHKFNSCCHLPFFRFLKLKSLSASLYLRIIYL